MNAPFNQPPHAPSEICRVNEPCHALMHYSTIVTLPLFVVSPPLPVNTPVRLKFTNSPRIANGTTAAAMGLLTILKKIKEKEKEIRVLIL